ncbi:hypothetical protein [Hyalangium versicolor]|uniref:hypothetical protein n=1 Tax=Hyalangium versicolor TaxID=2861190 RepID=UPI001CCBEE52|nr:hypothetical protein [Hyalangium versicolor]
MSFNPIVLLLLMAAGVLAVGSVYLLRRVNAARDAAWAEFARGHGMSAQGLRLEGICEGLPLTVEACYLSTGRAKYIATVLRLRVDALLPPGFCLEREGFGDRVPRRVGKGDPENSGARFDALLDWKSLSPETASLLQHERVREQLHEMARVYTAFRIRDGWIEAEQPLVPANAEELEAFIRPALRLVLTLEQTLREHT